MAVTRWTFLNSKDNLSDKKRDSKNFLKSLLPTTEADVLEGGSSGPDCGACGNCG